MNKKYILAFIVALPFLFLSCNYRSSTPKASTTDIELSQTYHGELFSFNYPKGTQFKSSGDHIRQGYPKIIQTRYMKTTKIMDSIRKETPADTNKQVDLCVASADSLRFVERTQYDSTGFCQSS